MPFTTAAEMVTELIEAQSQMQLTRARNRWMRYDLIVIDELGYTVHPALIVWRFRKQCPVLRP
jgi:DNA replication protein DnaC